MNHNQALAKLRRELYDLSELARDVASLCGSNSIMPHLKDERLAYQVAVLGNVEEQMLATISAIVAFEQATGVQVTLVSSEMR